MPEKGLMQRALQAMAAAMVVTSTTMTMAVSSAAPRWAPRRDGGIGFKRFIGIAAA